MSLPRSTLTSFTETTRRDVLPSKFPLVVEGRGLHTGKLFRLLISPGRQPQQGIVFRLQRDGVEYAAPAFWLRVSGTSRATALVLRGESRRRFELFTVEHFLAAACVAGWHDLDVVIETPEGPCDALEMPVLDGSGAEWFRLLTEGGLSSARGDRVAWKIIRSLEVSDGPRRVVFTPLAEPGLTRYNCSVHFGTALKQNAFFEIDWARLPEAQREFRARIAPARTFGFRAELEALEKRGLARGGTLDNAILLDGDDVVNEGGFRLANELAAHKLLDAVGDFFLLGAPFLGHVDLTQAGHSMHLRALEEAFRTGAFVKGRLTAAGVFVRD